MWDSGAEETCQNAAVDANFSFPGAVPGGEGNSLPFPFLGALYPEVAGLLRGERGERGVLGVCVLDEEAFFAPPPSSVSELKS